MKKTLFIIGNVLLMLMYILTAIGTLIELYQTKLLFLIFAFFAVFLGPILILNLIDKIKKK